MFRVALHRKSVMDSINNKDVPRLRDGFTTKLPFRDGGVTVMPRRSHGLGSQKGCVKVFLCLL